MPAPIYWSAKAQRFYEEGSNRGFVGRDQAVRSLIYDAKQDYFIDSRGQIINRELLATESRSAWRFTTQDLSGRVWVTGDAKSQLIDAGQTNLVKLGSNQQITGRIVVTTADGRVHVFEQSTGMGQNITAEELKTKLTKQARYALGNTQDKFGNNYEVDTPTVGNNTVRVDYYVRTIKLR